MMRVLVSFLACIAVCTAAIRIPRYADCGRFLSYCIPDYTRIQLIIIPSLFIYLFIYLIIYLINYGGALT